MNSPWKQGPNGHRSLFERLPQQQAGMPSAFSTFRDRRIGLFRFLLLGLAAWTVNALVLSDHGFLHLRELRAEEVAKENKRRELTERTGALQREIDESKEQRQERMAREKYRQSKSDEILYLFDRTAPAALADSAAADSSDTRRSERP